MNRGLRSSRLRASKVHEDVNPLEGVVNIVDAMLVFACGLMLSLIINWNVDINKDDMVQMDQGKEVSDVNQVKDKMVNDKAGTAYEKMGTVYKDPATGKLFMLTK